MRVLQGFFLPMFSPTVKREKKSIWFNSRLLNLNEKVS